MREAFEPLVFTKEGEELDLPDFDYQILRLTEKFLDDYPVQNYPELMGKRGRGYSCLLIQTYYDYFICIPYRTEIKHKYAYHFKNSKRSKEHCSGLDYTKMIIIKNPQYISNTDAVIDRDEYKETRHGIYKIVKDALSFLEDYIMYHTGKKILDKREYEKRYRYSSLKYFHNELGIN